MLLALQLFPEDGRRRLQPGLLLRDAVKAGLGVPQLALQPRQRQPGLLVAPVQLVVVLLDGLQLVLVPSCIIIIIIIITTTTAF